MSYIPQTRDETDVLFVLLSERYERRSVVVTSNLAFSDWHQVFKDPMTTAAAIDRLVHHSEILELAGPSFRADEAIEKSKKRTKKTDHQPADLTDTSKE
jgi:DNA replication protein DnaC